MHRAFGTEIGPDQGGRHLLSGAAADRCVQDAVAAAAQKINQWELKADPPCGMMSCSATVPADDSTTDPRSVYRPAFGSNVKVPGPLGELNVAKPIVMGVLLPLAPAKL